MARRGKRADPSLLLREIRPDPHPFLFLKGKCSYCRLNSLLPPLGRGLSESLPPALLCSCWLLPSRRNTPQSLSLEEPFRLRSLLNFHVFLSSPQLISLKSSPERHGGSISPSISRGGLFGWTGAGDWRVPGAQTHLLCFSCRGTRRDITPFLGIHAPSPLTE